VPVAPDAALTAALERLVAADPEEAPLAQLTDWTWDELYVFEEAARSSDIEAAVGEPILTEDYLGDRTLLVFLDDGRPVKGVTTYFAFSFLPDDARHFTGQVRAVPVLAESGGWLLFLLEPGQTV
jgi:hypothetical protein